MVEGDAGGGDAGLVCGGDEEGGAGGVGVGDGFGFYGWGGGGDGDDFGGGGGGGGGVARSGVVVVVGGGGRALVVWRSAGGAGCGGGGAHSGVVVVMEGGGRGLVVSGSAGGAGGGGGVARSGVLLVVEGGRRGLVRVSRVCLRFLAEGSDGSSLTLADVCTGLSSGRGRLRDVRCSGMTATVTATATAGLGSDLAVLRAPLGLGLGPLFALRLGAARGFFGGGGLASFSRMTRRRWSRRRTPCCTGVPSNRSSRNCGCHAILSSELFLASRSSV